MKSAVGKVVFIHIPKCAGSSIEKYFGVKPFDWRKANYENLTGWSKNKQLMLHHAKLNELVSKSLLTEKEIKEYQFFAIVRNPYSKIISDYFWFNRKRFIGSSFKKFASRRGVFEKQLNVIDENYRGDHLDPQHLFIENSYGIKVDIIRLENIAVELTEKTNIVLSSLDHEKKSRRRFHYSYYLTDKDMNYIKSIYKNDLDKFGYEFIDKRPKIIKFFPFFTRLIRTFKI